MRAEVAAVERHHYEEVKPVYDNQLSELSEMKKAMQGNVRQLQQTTQEMRDANKANDNKCHIELLRHEESLQTLEKIQQTYEQELYEANSKTRQQVEHIREVENCMIKIRNDSEQIHGDGSAVGRIAEKALMDVASIKSKRLKNKAVLK